MTTRPEADSMDIQSNKGWYLRPSRGETQTFTAESNGLIVDKRGFGLVELGSAAAFGTMTFKVGHLADLSDGFIIDGLSMDLTTVNKSQQTDGLACYPYFQPISDGTPTGDLLISLT